MNYTMTNSTITNTTFEYHAKSISIANATIDRCKFNGPINGAYITGALTKCQFEGLDGDININGPIEDMTILSNLNKYSAQYVLSRQYPSQLTPIAELIIDINSVPRLELTSHKECYLRTINPNNRITFYVQLASDDNTPRGTIVMFYPGEIPQNLTLYDVIPDGYALCDGNNDTPNLSGKFIRAAVDKSDVGDHTNDNLVLDNSGRMSSIQIREENLPPHNHTFATVEGDVYISGTTGSDSTVVITGNNNVTVNEGEGSQVFSGETFTVGDQLHSHSFSGSGHYSFTPLQNADTFPNTPINIEPESYALVFIMKL